LVAVGLLVAKGFLIAVRLLVAKGLPVRRGGVARRTGRGLAVGADGLVVTVTARLARTLGFVFLGRTAVFLEVDATRARGTRRLATATGGTAIFARWRRRRIGHFAGEINAGRFGQFLAELIFQHLGANHLDGAFCKVAELERTL